MSIKYTNILDKVEDDGVELQSYYGKYLADSYDDALKRAQDMDFAGGVREDGKEFGMMFSSKKEFNEIIKNKKYPLAIVPII